MMPENGLRMNKQLWLDHLDKVINIFLMDPPENWEFWFVGVFAFLLLAWIFTRVGERMDVSNVDGFAGFIAASVGTAVMLAAMTASSIYVAPALKTEVNFVFLVIAALVSSVVFAVPMIKFWTQAKYFNITVAWFVALISAIVIIVSFNYGFGSFNAESAKVRHRVSEHNQSIGEMLDYHQKKK